MMVDVKLSPEELVYIIDLLKTNREEIKKAFQNPSEYNVDKFGSMEYKGMLIGEFLTVNHILRELQGERS